ncbi:GGDEF domain-containing protein [Idiomarina xiamenensis]|nr:GGDEF domain-containing protein [Idiomarina xiamenensis]
MNKLTILRDKPKTVVAQESLMSVLSCSQHVQEHSDNLLQILQTSLDLEVVLGLYAQYLHSHFSVEHLLYLSDDRSLTLIDNGRAHQQTEQHNVMLYADRQYLGQLQYQLNKPLSQQQQQWLEGCHQQLTFPLRNALQYAELRQQAIRDHLTQLGNRSLLEEVLNHLSEQQQRQQQSQHSVVLIDLDGFKAVNDQYGHREGDAILRAYADLLKRVVRSCDQLFRYGGDEFVLLLENTSLNLVPHIFSRIKQHVERDHELARYQLSCSAGAVHIVANDNADSILERADELLYQAKAEGKSRLLIEHVADAHLS